MLIQVRQVFLILSVFLLTWYADDSNQRSNNERAALQVLHQYQQAYNGHDAAHLADVYLEDALLLPPDKSTISGRKAILEFWKTRMGTGLVLTPLRIAVNGNVGFIVGRYAFGSSSEGKFVVALQRDKDHQWKIAADIWNSTEATK